MTDRASKLSRRALLRAGFAAVGLGALQRSAGFSGPYALTQASFGAAAGGGGAGLGHPILDLGLDLGHSLRFESRVVAGIPFAAGWTGDGFPGDDFPFHSCENCFPDGRPPAPSGRVEIVVVGGGLSGLASAYMLRDRETVLLEMRDRVGGAAMGERWRGGDHSLGSAYFIVPDRRSSLETLYQELGVWPEVAVDDGGLAVQLRGEFVEDVLDWQGLTEGDRLVVERYGKLVQRMLEKEYPEIPLSKDPDAAARVVALDGVSFRDHVEAEVGGRLPMAVSAALQAYFHSSFGVGWEEVSAAAGWNFVAAEELGRIVLPGGNAGLAAAFHRRLHEAERGSGRTIIHPNHRVVDVRLHEDSVLVTWRDADAPGGFRSTLAEQVIVAAPKYVAKWLVHDLEALDPQKHDAIDAVNTCAYVVANVLLDAPVRLSSYDRFLLGDGSYPMDASAAEADSRVADLLDGGFGAQSGKGSSVLTLYWPLPWPAARFTLVGDGVWEDYAMRLAPQVRRIVADLGVDPDGIVQVRMSRWGHAMPIARVGAIAEGLPDHLRRSVADRIWFVNQDNWLLPAVETCLLEAEHFAAEVRARV